MRVFISWSGERSRQVAELFRWWLKCVIQATDPWVSSEDIESGSVWFNEIGDQLASTTIGIICLTQENKEKPWILFETGALTKGLTKGRVCPFLIDLEVQDVKNPMSQLNLSTYDKDGVFKLVKTINNSLSSNTLAQDVLSRAFETYWPQFQKRFEEILSNTDSSAPVVKRAEDDILTEILLTVRSFDRRIGNLEKPANYSRTITSLANANLGGQKTDGYQIIVTTAGLTVDRSIISLLNEHFDNYSFSIHSTGFDFVNNNCIQTLNVSGHIDPIIVDEYLRMVGIPCRSVVHMH